MEVFMVTLQDWQCGAPSECFVGIFSTEEKANEGLQEYLKKNPVDSDGSPWDLERAVAPITVDKLWWVK